MLGAILGDIIGSPYEFDWNNIKTKEFPLFTEKSHFTDDTVMTIAVADALLNCNVGFQSEVVENAVIKSLRAWGQAYPNESYGNMFNWWLHSDNPQPYNSFGNGAAMRISPVGWLFDGSEYTKLIARWVTRVTHNHIEGIKGAEAVVTAIYLARKGADKDTIKRTIRNRIGYDLDRTIDEIRPSYHHVESCQETVPEAIIAFLESTDFEDAIRTAVSLGGDSDTLTCITGGIAEAYYGIPENLKQECLSRLDPKMIDVVHRFNERVKTMSD